MVMWLRSGEEAALRLGVVTSKRTFRRSPDRSRARRLLREAFRINRSKLTGEYDIILIGRKKILDVKRQDVEKELIALAVKAGILE
jgi:ribonuclease P protein component